MYCGVLPERSSVRERLMGARAELALIASILAAAHCANYLGSLCGRPIDGCRRSELEPKRFLDNRARPARPARRSRGYLGEVRSPSDAAGCLEVRPKELVRFLRADIRARAARFISFSSEGPYRSARFVRCGRGNLLPLLRSTRSYMDESACEGIDGFGLRGYSEFLAPFRGGFSTRRFIFDCKGAERAATGQFGFPIDSLRCTGREMREAASH